MATQNIIPKIIFNGDGSNTKFQFGFPFETSEDLTVYLYRGSTKQERVLSASEYEVKSNIESQNGGEITFPSSTSSEKVLSSEDKLCVMRTGKYGNDHTFENQNRLFPKAVEEADNELAMQILNILAKLQSGIFASVFDTMTPEQRWEWLKENIDTIIAEFGNIQSKLSSLEEDIIEEENARIEEDTKLYEEIQEVAKQVSEGISNIISKLEEEAKTRKSEDEKRILIEKLSKAISVLSFEATASSLVLKTTTVNTSSGQATESNLYVPMADDTKAGAMSKESYSEIRKLRVDVDTLKGNVKKYYIPLGSSPVTQEQYQTAWEQASGSPVGSIPPDGTTIVNTDVWKEVVYVSSSESDKWVEKQEASIPVATDTTPGLVKGNSEAGKITVESDGSMSLNGYDNIVTGITDNGNAIATEKTRAETAEKSVSDSLNAHTGNSSIHVASGEKDTWNGKYSKPSAGIPESDLDSSTKDKINGALQKSGGSMSGILKAAAIDSADAIVRNIKISSATINEGDALPAGSIYMVYE